MEDTESIINNVLRIENIRATKAIEYKQELEAAGLKLNIDFQWRWQSSAEHDTSSAEFTFKNPLYVTFYKLRWE